MARKCDSVKLGELSDDERRRAGDKELDALHGDGGVIAITPDGQLAWSFNTPGMFRARLAEGGKLEVHIYKDEQDANQ